MKHTPRISVLMPAYNSEKYIGEAIESILNQTFTDFEFIIINDGSTDNTANIIAKYAHKDKRIKFINHTKNSGLVTVLNEGLDVCSGEYIARMDSDDISLPMRFEKQIAYMDAHPECGVLGTGLKMFVNKEDVIQWPSNIKILNLIKENQIAHPTVMIRKSVMDKYGFKYDKNYKHAEDFELWSRMVMVTELHNLSEILLHYRWGEENISVIHNKEQWEMTKRIKNNMLDKITDDKSLQILIVNIVEHKNKCGILFPKWASRIICLFIWKRATRHNFRDKYVKD